MVGCIDGGMVLIDNGAAEEAVYGHTDTVWQVWVVQHTSTRTILHRCAGCQGRASA